MTDEIPKIELKGCLLDQMRITTAHELASAISIMKMTLEYDRSDERHKKALEYVNKKLPLIRKFLSYTKIGRNRVPTYFLWAYYEVMYLIENITYPAHLKIYDQKRQNFHDQILSFMAVERNSDADLQLKQHIESEYFDYVDKMRPELDAMKNVIVNQIRERA